MTRRTREQTLLLDCAASRPSAATQADIRALAAAADWTALIDLAFTHGVLTVMLAGLRAADAMLPRHVGERLGASFADVAAANLSLTAQAARVLEALDRSGIRATLCKGPALAIAAYGHLGLRPCSDIDVLVPREDIQLARDAMLVEDYQLSDRTVRAFQGIWPDADREYVLVPRDQRLAVVELQTTVASWPLAIRLETRDLVERSIRVDAAGVALRTLCPEDHLLVLAIHGFRHLWESVRLISDIDWAAGGEVDWMVLFARARTARMQRVLVVALLLANALFATPLPGDVLERIRRDRVAVRLASRIEWRLFAPPFFRKICQDSMWVGSREHASDKVRFIARLLASKVIRSCDRVTAYRARHAHALRSAIEPGSRA